MKGNCLGEPIEDFALEDEEEEAPIKTRTKKSFSIKEKKTLKEDPDSSEKGLELKRGRSATITFLGHHAPKISPKPTEVNPTPMLLGLPQVDEVEVMPSLYSPRGSISKPNSQASSDNEDDSNSDESFSLNFQEEDPEETKNLSLVNTIKKDIKKFKKNPIKKTPSNEFENILTSDKFYCLSDDEDMSNKRKNDIGIFKKYIKEEFGEKISKSSSSRHTISGGNQRKSYTAILNILEATHNDMNKGRLTVMSMDSSI